MLHQFLMHSKVNQQLCIQIYPLFCGFPSHLGHQRALTRVPCVINYLFYMLCSFSIASVVSNSVTHGLQPTRLLRPWDSLGKNTGAGCHALLQGVFFTQGSNLGLLHCRQILYCLSHQGILYIVVYKISISQSTHLAPFPHWYPYLCYLCLVSLFLLCR